MLFTALLETATGIYFLYRLVLDGFSIINFAASVVIVYYLLYFWMQMDWILAPVIHHIPFYVDLDMHLNE